MFFAVLLFKWQLPEHGPCKPFNYTKGDHKIGIRRQNKNDLKAWLFGDWLKKGRAIALLHLQLLALARQSYSQESEVKVAVIIVFNPDSQLASSWVPTFLVQLKAQLVGAQLPKVNMVSKFKQINSFNLFISYISFRFISRWLIGKQLPLKYQSLMLLMQLGILVKYNKYS